MLLQLSSVQEDGEEEEENDFDSEMLRGLFGERREASTERVKMKISVTTSFKFECPEMAATSWGGT